MESLYFLIPLSLLVLAGAVALFFWAVNSGQYDDIDREGERILFDEDLQQPGESREEEIECKENKKSNSATHD